jgi:hypothetical protein
MIELTTPDSRLPVATRENIRTLILSPEHDFGGEGQVLGAAIPQTRDLIMYGNRSNITVFIHEAAHILDMAMTNNLLISYSRKHTSQPYATYLLTIHRNRGMARFC